MADEKISQLSDAGAPQSSDQFVVARSGSSLSMLWSAISAAAGGAVSSVFGRTGAVTAQTGDYTAAQVGALPSTETLDQIATANATAASVAMNTHKLTGLAAGSGNGDSLRYEQLIGLYLLLTGGTMSGAIAMGSNKITGLTNGSAASDAAAFGQIPTALPPNGTAGGDLSGTYPNPAVAPAANVAMGSHKLTGLAAGSGAGDSLRYEQVIGSNVLAVANLVAGSAGQVLGGTGPAYAFPPGYEIGYAQITSTVNVTSTTESSGTTVISPGAITFDGDPVLVTFFGIASAPRNAATDLIFLSLFEGATQITELFTLRSLSTAAVPIVPILAQYRFTPTAGSHTYTVTGAVTNTTGTPGITAGAGGTGANPPAFVRFTKV